jgi:endonuclease YncB( thermonuclease family)
MKTNALLSCLAIAAAAGCLAAPAVQAQQFDAKVLSVQSADSFTASVYGRPWRVRVAEVTAVDPKGRNTLASLVGGKTVSITVVGTDADGRMLGRVSAAGQDVGAALVAAGAAKAGAPAVAAPSYAAEKSVAATKAPPRVAVAAGPTPPRTSGTGNIKEEEIREFLKRTPDMASVRAAALK